MSDKLVHLHMMVRKKDLDLIDAFCANHGDRSLHIRHIIKSHCEELAKGDKFILPPEIRAQFVEDNKNKEHEDVNDEISG